MKYVCNVINEQDEHLNQPNLFERKQYKLEPDPYFGAGVDEEPTRQLNNEPIEHSDDALNLPNPFEQQ